MPSYANPVAAGCPVRPSAPSVRLTGAVDATVIENPEPDGLLQSMVVPDYAGACVCNIVPALLEYPPLGDGWMPERVADADQVVLFVVDGLGWHQLRARATIAPVLAAASGTAITTVAPSTTATALTSIATGTPPGEHGVVGYKVRVGAETLNTLRYTTRRGDARAMVPPRDFQRIAPFGGRAPVVVNRKEFVDSGFTTTHLDGVRYRPYGTMATLVHEVVQATAEGERFVYAYYDGLDRVGHERGHGAVFDAELAFIDRLIGDLRGALADDVVLLVTADHGQVDTGETVRPIAPEVLRHCTAVSGEDRFIWLHAPGSAAAAARSATDHHGDEAWVLPVDEAIDRGLFGPRLTGEARARLGDVAIIARGRAAFFDPQMRPPRLLARHGSLTPAEMHVPLLAV